MFRAIRLRIGKPRAVRLSIAAGRHVQDTTRFVFWQSSGESRVASRGFRLRAPGQQTLCVLELSPGARSASSLIFLPAWKTALHGGARFRLPGLQPSRREEPRRVLGRDGWISTKPIPASFSIAWINSFRRHWPAPSIFSKTSISIRLNLKSAKCVGSRQTAKPPAMAAIGLLDWAKSSGVTDAQVNGFRSEMGEFRLSYAPINALRRQHLRTKSTP